MSDPIVSVIIPAFNAEAFIASTIDSVLAQSLTNIEIIVVDDGSTDATAALISQTSDPRLRLIQQDNKGQSAAINAGVEKSCGTYIKLLDADDWINPDHLQSQVNAASGENCLVSCKWGYFVKDFTSPIVRQELTNRDYTSPIQWIVDSLTKDEGMMGGWMWLIPRLLWQRAGGFDQRLSLNNDFHFTIKLLLASDGVRFAEGAVYSYRKGIGGTLSGTSDRMAMESAYLTTDLGTKLLLEREDSPRIRKISADRFQQWLFRFYPLYPDLVEAASSRIDELGGSELDMQGGLLLKVLQPIIGWKGVRKIQEMTRRVGWQKVLNLKARRRTERLDVPTEESSHGHE